VKSLLSVVQHAAINLQKAPVPTSRGYVDGISQKPLTAEHVSTADFLHFCVFIGIVMSMWSSLKSGMSAAATGMSEGADAAYKAAGKEVFILCIILCFKAIPLCYILDS